MAELRSPTSSPRTDAMQAALVGLAQRGDAAAASTLVTQLRPGLVTLARWAHGNDQSLGSIDEAGAEVLSVFNETVMRHPLERRPTKIAANLLLDTRQRLWRSRRRQDQVTRAAVGAARTADQSVPSPPEARVDELDLMSVVTSGLDDLPGTDRSRRLTARLAYRSWILEESSGAIAADLGMGPEAVRARLCRLRTALRERRRAEQNKPCQPRRPYEPTSRRFESAPPDNPVGPSLAKRQ